MATALNDLVGKWFYGTDLPTIPANLSYNSVAGPLYGNNANPGLDVPSSADMSQGSVGDCYVISALGAIADSAPAAIENMIIPNGVENGIASYTVRFYYQNPSGAFVADYVTVNALLPGYSPGNLAFAHTGPDGSYWLPIVEKAYAEWNETGREGRNGQNTYLSLSDGFMQCVDAQVLGANAAVSFPSAGDTTAEQALIAALQNNEAVTVGSMGCPALNLVGDHAYDVASYDANPASPMCGTFQLKNPWGWDEPAPLTWAELCDYCGWVVVADTAGTAAASGSVGPEQSLVGNAPVPTVLPSSRLVTPRYAVPITSGSVIGVGIASWGRYEQSTEIAADVTANDTQSPFTPSAANTEGIKISGTDNPPQRGNEDAAPADSNTLAKDYEEAGPLGRLRGLSTA